MAASNLVSKLDYQPEKLYPALVKLLIVMMAVGRNDCRVSLPGLVAF